jgi:outer membrane protein, multidrug efflux system
VRKLLVAALIGSTLAGCNLAPEHVRPAGAVPAALPQGGAYPALATDAPDVTAIGWRDFFTDPRLQRVIEQGLANNRDLRIAAGNVLQARAQYRVQRADLAPTTAVNGAATYTNNAFGATGGGGLGAGTGTGGGAGTGGAGGVGGGLGAGGAGVTTGNLEIYSVNVGFSQYELDLFGRVRNLTQAALEQYLATEEGERATRVSMIGEIASAWLTLAADQDRLRLARDTLTSFQESLRLTQAQFRIGVSSELEVRQAETNYQAARNDIATATTQIAQDQNALNLLVGTTVAAEDLPTNLGVAAYTLNDLPANLSSEILLKRPDVLQAEHQLAAESANIGAARAAFFPTISLTATLGTISTALSGLFGSNSETWTGSPAVSLPIFDGGRRRGNLDYAQASRRVAIATYERTLQTAFREVADALATRGTIGEQVAARTARAEAASVAARLADARYRAGVDSFLTSLDAQRTAYAAEQDLVTTRAARATNLVALYRTLGGGLAGSPVTQDRAEDAQGNRPAARP